MKKLLMIFAVTSIVVAGAELKDGEYSVKTDKSIWFWFPKTTMTVKNGEVVSATHDRVKKDGRLASQDDWYNNKMLKKTGSNPEQYAREIPENYFKAGRDLQGMDSVAGATDSVMHFQKQMEFLLDKAEAGETGDFEMSKKLLK